MLVPFRTALLPGALLAASLVATPVLGKDVYRASLDPAIPHHAAILDTLSKLEKSPGDAQLHNDLGCLVAWDGFWRDALRSFEAAADLAPNDGRPHFNAGLVEALRGEWGSARRRFRKAVKVDPGNWPGWWMLGFSEESLGHDDAAVDAYSRSVRVDTSLFDPRYNPFAVATRLKARVLLETYERRRVDAALPFANQLSDPSRVASFFQARVKAPAAVTREEPATSGPVVTQVPPAGPGRGSAPAGSSEPSARRRRPYGARPGVDREEPAEPTPPPAPEQPEEQKAPPQAPGPGEESGAPGTAVRAPASTGEAASPGPGFGIRRVPVPTPKPDPE